jgi:hypothetical protein
MLSMKNRMSTIPGMIPAMNSVAIDLSVRSA